MATLSSPSLSRLITNVRNFLSQPNPNNSTWTDTEISEYLNEGVRLYFAEMATVNEGQFTTKTNLDITANSETIALPTDCFVVKALRKKNNTRWEILTYENDLTGSYDTSGGNNSNNFMPLYFFRGNNIVLRPTPNFSETAGLELEYMQMPDVMSASTDALSAQIPALFRNLIEMYAVYKAKLKESLVNGVNMHAIAQENVSLLALSFKDAIVMRSKSPQYIIPFNPES